MLWLKIIKFTNINVAFKTHEKNKMNYSIRLNRREIHCKLPIDIQKDTHTHTQTHKHTHTRYQCVMVQTQMLSIGLFIERFGIQYSILYRYCINSGRPSINDVMLFLATLTFCYALSCIDKRDNVLASCSRGRSSYLVTPLTSN